MTDHTLGRRTVLTDRVTNWPMIWLTIALVPPLLIMAQPSRDDWCQPAFLVPLAVVVVAVAVNVLTLSSLRTAAGPQGLTAYFGVLGFPRFRYPVARIATVRTATVTPSQWPWGITWSPRNGLTLALRSGPAVRLALTSGRPVTVGVSDAEQVVAVLAAAGCATD